MKKKLFGFIILLSTLACIPVFAAGKRIAVFNPVCEGLSEDETNWIPSSVRRRLEANLNDYTTYQLVDVQNEDKIKQLQKKAENFSYDQETSIELGKLVSAELGLFTSVTKANGRYILSANVTNLTTGIRLSSSTTDSVAEPVSLFEGAGSSVNKITVKMCNDLGINLSAIDLYVLLKGQDLTQTDQISMTQEELNRYQKKQQELEKQIKEVSLSTDIDAQTRKAKLEAEKTLAEQQKQIAEERLERLRLQNQRLLQDQEQQKSRTAAQRQKIEEAAAKAEQQAKLVRQQKIDRLSVDQQIAVVEAKKQALLDIHNSVLAQERLIKQNANEDYKTQCIAIDEEPLRNGETDSDGNMLPAVKQMRNERKLQLKREIEAKALEDLASIQGKTTTQEIALYNDIQNDLNKLKVRRTITSIEDDRILSIGNYAGDLYEWDTTVGIYINDVKIFGQKANIAYQSVSGKAPVAPTSGNTERWNDYLDTVDLYDYMFRRNVPAVTLEIDYSIEAMSEYYPSMYKMTLYEFRFVDTVSGRTVQTITPAKTSYKFSVSPAVDISYYKSGVSAATDNSSAKTASTNVAKTETVKIGSDAKKRKSSKNNPLFDQSNGGGARCNFGFNYGVLTQEKNYSLIMQGLGNWEFYASFPMTTWMFSEIDFGFLSLPQRFGNYYSGSQVAKYCMFDTGFNVRVGSKKKKPANLYALAGVGLAFDDELISVQSKEEASVLLYKGAVGIDWQLTNYICLTTELGVMGLDKLKPYYTTKIGVAFTLPNLVFF